MRAAVSESSNAIDLRGDVGVCVPDPVTDDAVDLRMRGVDAVRAAVKNKFRSVWRLVEI